MSILRLLFIVLLLLNLLALAASTGLLGVSAPRGEPERLTNQLNPERIRLLDESPAPLAAATPATTPADPEPVAEEGTNGTGGGDGQSGADAAPGAAAVARCIAFDGLGGETADAVVRNFDTAELAVQRTGAEAITGWWVRIPPDGTREYAERKGRELRALGVDEFYIVQDSGPNQYAVSLGLFKTEAAAKQHLERLRKFGVRSASIGTRSTTVYRVEVRGAQALIDARMTEGSLPSAARPGDCAQP